MKVHAILVEPANYTQDLIENVYQKEGISYSFIRSSSEAANNKSITATATYLFDQNSILNNVRFLWSCAKQHQLIIFNGYTHIEFLVLWVFSVLNGVFIAIESDTPYQPVGGIKGLLKQFYLNLIFANKRILGLAGGNGAHRDLFLNYGMPAERVFVAPMVVNNIKYYKEILVGASNNTALKFIFVGRLAPEKNVILLVKAFQTVLQQGRKATLDIVGDGICRPELETLIAHTPAIKLAGKKFGPELLQAYHNADVMVLPSCFEPWGLVVNEALAAGLPIVCSDAVGAAHDLVLGPDAGWMFESDNAQQLTDVLLNIIDNPSSVVEKAERGQRFMLNYWNYNLYQKSLNQVFDHVRAS